MKYEYVSMRDSANGHYISIKQTPSWWEIFSKEKTVEYFSSRGIFWANGKTGVSLIGFNDVVRNLFEMNK